MKKYLTKKQRRALRKEQERTCTHTDDTRRRTRMNFFVAFFCMVLLGIGILFFWQSQRKASQYVRTSPNTVVAEHGLHRHATLKMVIKGKQIAIPKGIGLEGVENFIHTHEADGVIHMEFPGRVWRDDLKLGRFFQVWKKDIRSFGALQSMTVNGKENTNYEDYEMKDNDTIELQYQ